MTMIHLPPSPSDKKMETAHCRKCGWGIAFTHLFIAHGKNSYFYNCPNCHYSSPGRPLLNLAEGDADWFEAKPAVQP
jgi:hypothetical protein